MLEKMKKHLLAYLRNALAVFDNLKLQRSQEQAVDAYGVQIVHIDCIVSAYSDLKGLEKGRRWAESSKKY